MARDELSTIKYNVTRAEGELQKADREWAYFKNEKFGEPWAHYQKSQEYYAQAKERAERTLETMRENDISDADLENRLKAILEKCENNK